MAEQVDAQDLKSWEETRAGSIPAISTKEHFLGEPIKQLYAAR